MDDLSPDVALMRARLATLIAANDDLRDQLSAMRAGRDRAEHRCSVLEHRIDEAVRVLKR